MCRAIFLILSDMLQGNLLQPPYFNVQPLTHFSHEMLLLFTSIPESVCAQLVHPILTLLYYENFFPQN